MAATAFSPSHLPQNQLLAALPAPALSRVWHHLTPIFMARGDVLYEPGEPVDWLYFPISSILSVSRVLLDGHADSIALVGSEGYASVAVFLGSPSAPCRATVQIEGWGYRIEREWITVNGERDAGLRAPLLRYAQYYMTQVAQTGVCNRHHSIDQQLCRWLLMLADRLPAGEILLTQEKIAALMGVRRESVTAAVQKLQINQAIRCHRGHVTVVDRRRLEALCCECYAVVRRERQRLLWNVRAPARRKTSGVTDMFGIEPTRESFRVSIPPSEIQILHAGDEHAD